MSFGDRLRMLRTERGLTQQQLADKFNYKKSSISGYEREENAQNELQNMIDDFLGVVAEEVKNADEFPELTYIAFICKINGQKYVAYRNFKTIQLKLDVFPEFIFEKI